MSKQSLLSMSYHSCLMRMSGVLFVCGLALLFQGCATTSDDPELDDLKAEDEDTGKDEALTENEEENQEETDPEVLGDDDDDDDDDDITEVNESTEEEQLTTEDFPESVGYALGEDCSDPDCKEATGSIQSASGSPAVEAWQPSNASPAPLPTHQQDLKLICSQMGPGLEPGFLRYGCNSVRKTDGHHYGIVKGWWGIVRKDGYRAKSRSLNFREGGYDMTFDVAEADASYGIKVIPIVPGT